MKKQVLSFTEFINEAYSMINEGRSWQDVQNLLQNRIDGESAKFLAYLSDCFESDARKDAKVDLLKLAGETFGKIISEKLSGKYTKIDSVSTEMTKLEYKKAIQGSVDVSSNDLAGKSFKVDDVAVGAFKIDGSGKMKIEDLLNMINIYNMKKLATFGALETKDSKNIEFANISKKEKFSNKDTIWGQLGFSVRGERKLIKDSGSQNQYYITDIGEDATNISIGKWENNKSVAPKSGVTPNSLSYDVGLEIKTKTVGNSGRTWTASDRSKKAGTAEFTYVFYALDPISNTNRCKQKGGDNVSVSSIKEVKIPFKEPDITQTLEIQENGAIFETGSSKLTEQGKKDINNAIASNFTSVSEIIVQGSASQEGPSSKNDYTEQNYNKDKAGNLELAKKRAESVVTYLKGSTEGADVKLNESEPAIIQDFKKTEETERAKHRKVILTIKGTKVTKGETTEKILYIPITGKIKYDKIVIQELQMTFQVSIKEEKAKKDGLFKKGVDTAMGGAAKRFKTKKLRGLR
jgi:hypothetical protein